MKYHIKVDGISWCQVKPEIYNAIPDGSTRRERGFRLACAHGTEEEANLMAACLMMHLPGKMVEVIASNCDQRDDLSFDSDEK